MLAISLSKLEECLSSVMPRSLLANHSWPSFGTWIIQIPRSLIGYDAGRIMKNSAESAY